MCAPGRVAEPFGPLAFTPGSGDVHRLVPPLNEMLAHVDRVDCRDATRTARNVTSPKPVDSDRRRTSTPGTAPGTGAPISTMARRSGRRPMTSALSTRSPSHGR
jgi:hypothetical protein